MPVTPDQLAQLQAVNAKWNAVPYVAENVPGPNEPPEFWGDQPVAGWSWECRCYVEAKAEELRTSGWPVADLLSVFCWTEVVNPPDQYGGRAYHCVLRVGVDDDLYILDSREADVYRPTSPPADYLWNKEQVPGTDGYRDISTTGVF